MQYFRHIYYSGTFLIFIGLVGFLSDFEIGLWLFLAGSIGIGFAKFLLLKHHYNEETKRIMIIQFLNALILTAVFVLMFLNNENWIALLILAAFIEFYVSIRIPDRIS